MPFSRFSDAYRIEVCTFYKDSRCRLGYPTVQSAKDPCKGKGFICITDHKIFLVKFSFNFIEGCEFGSCRKGFNMYLTAGNFVCIKEMKGLAHLVHHVI